MFGSRHEAPVPTPSRYFRPSEPTSARGKVQCNSALCGRDSLSASNTFCRSAGDPRLRMVLSIQRVGETRDRRKPGRKLNAYTFHAATEYRACGTDRHLSAIVAMGKRKSAPTVHIAVKPLNSNGVAKIVSHQVATRRHKTGLFSFRITNQKWGRPIAALTTSPTPNEKRVAIRRSRRR